MPRKALPKRGDLIQCDWIDIVSNPTGDPATGAPIERTSYGLFWAQEERGGFDCLITTDTLDEEDHHQSGYTVYPIGAVVEITVIKRARRK